MANSLAFWLILTLFYCLSLAKVHEPALPSLLPTRNHAVVERSLDDGDVASLSRRSASSVEEARKLVEKGQVAMARENARIMHKTSHMPQPGVMAAKKPQKSVVVELQYEDGPIRASAMGASSESLPSYYVVPTELVEAASILAEATPLPQDGSPKFLAESETVSSKRGHADTYAMPPVLRKGDGLHEYGPELGQAYRFGDNKSQVVQPGQTKENGSHDEKRSASHWWMASIKQRGSSPFAPEGYKVWRNVKDYGAKGDGKSDDTAAINRAISDGGRCGRNCSGSTIHPATVYFPPGVYMVSSSIIQYYNTEIIGDPVDMPRIKAAPSFIGLGVITTNVYESDDTKYPSKRNFLRSVRNLYIDIRCTPKDAQVCGIHWQVGQGTTIENVVFWADTLRDITQQGIFMEDGNGGFMSNILFLGGKYGAYIGNKQFTARDLWFSDVLDAAIRLRWAWGLTLQGINFKNVKTGIKIMESGEKTADEQGVGSLVVTDIQGEAMDAFITSTLSLENSTSLMVQNALMNDVDAFVTEAESGKVLLAGDGDAEEILPIKSWGFGRVTDTSGNTTFVSGGEVAAPNSASMLTRPGLSSSIRDTEYYFTRQRPRFVNLGGCDLVDVKAWGAKGDGKIDDTVALNRAFEAAADMSAIVYIPYGVYVIKDTVTIPVGSRVIGQAWPQLMGTGAKFEDISKPRPIIRVGVPGNQGVAEIQSVMFTVRGPTAGAILVEWNVHESFQGSAGLWDSHFRVGGAEGSQLQVVGCPQLPDEINPACIATSLMLHITPKASAYLENIWVWAADHDIDDKKQASINVYAARGILIESTGPTWLWGTSVQHCALYQYQLSGAENVFLGLIQTESPYYQPHPASPGPFSEQLGAFADDPIFDDCRQDSRSCRLSWAARVIDSKTIYILGTGMYSWFQEHDGKCIDNGKGDCQDKVFYTEQTSDIWVYSLVAAGAVEMISPFNGQPVNATDNRNGFASSLLAWRGGINGTTGWRDFDGYTLYNPDAAGIENFTKVCQKALTAKIKCHPLTRDFTDARVHCPLGGAPSRMTWACADGCKKSIEYWVESVEKLCKGQTWSNGAVAEYQGGYIQYGLMEQCQKDDKSGRWCNDVLAEFKDFGTSVSWDDMHKEELCSDCYVGRLRMMQASPYSVYGLVSEYQDALQHVTARCGLKGQDLKPQPSVFPTKAKAETWCLSEKTYDTRKGDTCDSVAQNFSISSASIVIGNSNIGRCSNLDAGTKLYLSLECKTYTRQKDESCVDIYIKTGVSLSSIKQYNPWLTRDCSNIESASKTYGNILCISPVGGEFESNVNKSRGAGGFGPTSEYTDKATAPPGNAKLAEGTTDKCGRWHVVKQGESCASVTQSFITASVFRMVNPSLLGGECSEKLIPGRAYCTGPVRGWAESGEKN
ncbi:Glucan 1,3-beta-glucosidase [Fusarium keratoplasticum]|uniref:Glucan 1,3-beta-glucosidase n=1 Tax=Fusarium keratoplasticum TaxID=1328300 RepID=A0ACC0R902_9HYPO|nr:Glucan 1,3-beta-glucosidase [Fusarium keratoplasticum]KAI8676052.1 Glucan 1,3-beta-glucosidase [Fusarium keratoplasticum]